MSISFELINNMFHLRLSSMLVFSYILYMTLITIKYAHCSRRAEAVKSVSKITKLNNTMTSAECFGAMRDARRAKYHLALRKSKLKAVCVTTVSDKNITLAKVGKPTFAKTKIKSRFSKMNRIHVNQDVSSELDRLVQNSFRSFNITSIKTTIKAHKFTASAKIEVFDITTVNRYFLDYLWKWKLIVLKCLSV